MMAPYEPYISQSLGELADKIVLMIGEAPSLHDLMGYILEKNIETEFAGLKQSVGALRAKLGEENYARLTEMAAEAKVLFGEDPEGKTERADKGWALLYGMRDIAEYARRRPRRNT
jgi:hypothetical protein